MIPNLCIALLSLLLVSSATAEPHEGPAVPRERFHLYLLLGQSNMAGRGHVPAQDRELHPRIFALDAEGRWAPAHDPLHPSSPLAESGEVRGVGPGMSFARAMVERDPDLVIGLIPCAVGGSSIRSWRRGRKNQRWALDRARAAIRDGELRGILWHQGESDTFEHSLAERYEAQLDAMIREWRDALRTEVPFVAGRLAEPNDGASLALVNRALAQLPKRVARTAVVAVTGLETRGPWHFTASAARELGRRYAAAMIALQGEDGP